MRQTINWKLGLLSTLVVLLITLPFTRPLFSIAIAIAGGLFMLLNEGGLGTVLFSRNDKHTATNTDEEQSDKKATYYDQAQTIFTNYPLAVRLGLVLVVATLPFGLNRYTTEIATLGLIYVTLAIGLNFIVGLSGLLALGYIAFYAVGAYTYALLNVNYGVNFFLAIPISFATGALAGALVGLPVLRLRGDYLAIVTLGFGEITRIILNNWDELTAGPNGIMNIARPEIFGIKVGTPLGYYYIAMVLAIVTMFVQYRLANSKVGRAWDAIREDELAAAHTGVPVVKMKMLAMMLGGAWAGIAGALFAARMTHVSPESFTFLESVLVLCMVVLGGMGSVIGVTVGAIVLIVAPELLRSISNYRMLVFGLLMVLMMQYRRSGFIPSKRMKASKI